MAQKAATIYVIDVAPSMQLKQEGGDKSYLQCSTEAVASMIQDKVRESRKKVLYHANVNSLAFRSC
jgi:hypothetical protein